MTTGNVTVDALTNLAPERVYGRVRVTATLPDTDGSVPDPVVFTERATEINEESDNWGRTIHVNFGMPSDGFHNATGASGFELTAKYKTNGEWEQISGQYLMAPQEEITLRYGEIHVRSVERMKDDSEPLEAVPV